MGPSSDATQDEPPAELDLVVGQSQDITLRGLGTAGYRWDHTLEGSPDVVDLEWTRGYPPGTAPAMPVGRSAPETLTVTALASGEVTLQLSQRRSWETTSALHSHDVLVRVEDPDSSGHGAR